MLFKHQIFVGHSGKIRHEAVKSTMHHGIRLVLVHKQCPTAGWHVSGGYQWERLERSRRKAQKTRPWMRAAVMFMQIKHDFYLLVVIFIWRVLCLYVCVFVCCMDSKCWPCLNHKCGILRFINHNAVLYPFTKLSEHVQSSSKFFDAQANVIGLVLFFPLDIFNIYSTAFPNKMPKP